MDDFFEFFIFCILLPAMVVLLIFSLIGVAKNNAKEEKKEDKRYELCLKRDMQWVDGNCVK